MLRLFVVLSLAVVVACLGLLSASSSPPRADLVYVNPSGVHTLDPAQMSWTQDFRLALNLWEGLTTWDSRTLAPIAGAAMFPPDISEDGLVHTFAIRDDAKWSNGDPLTAADFARGWRRSLEPGVSADYAFFLTDYIAGATEYADWRRSGVAVLSLLLRLRDDDNLNEAEWARLLAKSSRPHWISFLDRESARDVDSDALTPREASRRLQARPIDWADVHRKVLRRHADDMESRFDQVDVRPLADKTLRVTLRQPCPYILDLLAFPVFLPIHESIELSRDRPHGEPVTEEGLVIYDPQWTKPAAFMNGSGLTTNGPYRLEEWTFRMRVRLSANPHYHSAADVRCKTVEMLMMENINASLMAYENGQVDLLTDLGVPYVHEITRLAMSGERPDFRLCHVAATYFLNFNCRSTGADDGPNPLTDSRVREALARSIDKRAIVETVIQRGDRVAHSFVPPGSTAGYEPPVDAPFDPAAARARLAEAGYPDGASFPPVTLLGTGNDERIASAIARMWRENLGVTVSLQTKESKSYSEDKSEGRYTVARGNWYADYNDPTTFLDCLRSSNGNNDSGYASAAYDEWMDRAAREQDATRRFMLLQSAEKLVVTVDFPIVPLFHYTEPIAIKPHVDGIFPNARHWYPFKNATVRR